MNLPQFARDMHIRSCFMIYFKPDWPCYFLEVNNNANAFHFRPSTAAGPSIYGRWPGPSIYGRWPGPSIYGRGPVQDVSLWFHFLHFRPIGFTLGGASTDLAGSSAKGHSLPTGETA